jgi:hypothetical protein
MTVPGLEIPEELELLDDEEVELLLDDELLLEDELLDEEDPVSLAGSSPPPQPAAPRTAISGNIVRSIRIVDTLLAHRFIIRDKDSICYIDAPIKNARGILFSEIAAILFNWDFLDIDEGSVSH